MASVPTRASFPIKFHPLKSFCFPKQKLRMNAEKSFRVEWCEDDHIHGSTTMLVAIQPSVTSV